MGAKGTTKDWNLILGVTEALEAEKEAARLTHIVGSVNDIHVHKEDWIKLLLISLNALAATIMPSVFQYKFPPVLLAAWSLLVQLCNKERDFSQIALGIPRGHGKTTLVKIYVVFCILFTKKKFILIMSSTASLAENVLSDIMDMLSEPNIRILFGDWKSGAEVNRQDLKKFGFRGRNIILAAIGAGGSVRGLNIKNERPDIMIFEDIQTKECSESDIESKKLLNWMVGTAMKAKSPHGCLTIFCGNMYPGPNAILKKLKNNPNWIKFISGAILADYTALWEELRPIDELIKELDNDIAMGTPEIFFSEVMNDVDIGINNTVDLSKLKDWPWGEHEYPQGKFIIIDPATGKVGGDLVALGYFEVYDGTPGLRELIEESLSPGACILKALLWCLKYGVKCIAIESNSYQATLGYWFGRECERLSITGIECVEVYSNMQSKNSRIIMALKAVAANETILHSNVKARVMHQVSNWNPMKRDNVDGILDLLTYPNKVIEDYGSFIMSDENIQVIESDGATVHEDNSSF